MKKARVFSLFFALAILAPMAHAQHGANLTITPYGFGASTNVYRAPCTGAITGTPLDGGTVGTPSATGGGCSAVGTFTLIGNIPAGSNTFSDNGNAAGANVVYQFTSLCPAAGCTDTNMSTGESSPSLQIATALPTTFVPPAPAVTAASVTGFR
jgi:hypothetical protein